MKRPGSPASLLFPLIVPACAVFILTILAMIASVFGNPDAPVTKWLDRNVSTILTIEFVAVITLSVLAMLTDRIRTIRSASAPTPSADAPLPDAAQANQAPRAGAPHSTETNDLL